MVYKTIKITDIGEKDYMDTYIALHPTRKEHIDKLKNKKQRLCSLAGEFLAKRILKEHFGIKSPVIKRDEKGKPYTEQGIHISISHCDEMVAVVADTKSVGIDVEKIKPVSDTLINRVCTGEELEYVFKLSDREQVLYRFFEVWTAKEANFKKQGTGITDFKSVNILDLDRKIIVMEDYVIQIVV